MNDSSENIFNLFKRLCIDACNSIPTPTVTGVDPDYLDGRLMAVSQCINNIEKLEYSNLNKSPLAYLIAPKNGTDKILLSASSKCLSAYLNSSEFTVTPLFD